MKHILVTGGDGLLAHQLKQTAPREFEFSFLGRAEFELTKKDVMAQRLAELRPGAVDRSRQEKPQIPRVGDYGIPLHDEIDLTLRV